MLKLLGPAPSLAIGATITIDEAAQLGVERTTLLRLIAAVRLLLYCRLRSEPGILVNIAELDYEPATGEYEIAPRRYMPASAIETEQSGLLALPDSKAYANAVLTADLD